MHCRTMLLMLAFAGAPGIAAGVSPTDGAVQINTDFPGANAKVISVAADAVHLEPDLRGGRPWFYWCFEATAVQTGKVTFTFPEKVAGFQHGAIGFQGPAISTDQGKSWRWMGRAQVDGDSFSYDFASVDQPVRFAVTIPYVGQDLGRFLEEMKSNPHLKPSVLTHSREGREVKLLRIGEPSDGATPVLVTGRHHAAETMASFVLEGFLREAMSESEAGQAFRKKHVLYAVPLVDRDGVEEGDQGKNRRPHDHNRDYGENSIYPEIRAIKELDAKVRFRFTLDFHCPTLVMQDHQVMYFVGAKSHPRYNFENVSELASWIKRGLPKNAPAGPLVWLKSVETPTPMNSHYFGFKSEMIMAATLEYPFAAPGKAADPESCRGYGKTVLQAWVNTHFRAPTGDEDRPSRPDAPQSR